MWNLKCTQLLGVWSKFLEREKQNGSCTATCEIPGYWEESQGQSSQRSKSGSGTATQLARMQGQRVAGGKGGHLSLAMWKWQAASCRVAPFNRFLKVTTLISSLLCFLFFLSADQPLTVLRMTKNCEAMPCCTVTLSKSSHFPTRLCLMKALTSRRPPHFCALSTEARSNKFGPRLHVPQPHLFLAIGLWSCTIIKCIGQSYVNFKAISRVLLSGSIWNFCKEKQKPCFKSLPY